MLQIPTNSLVNCIDPDHCAVLNESTHYKVKKRSPRSHEVHEGESLCKNKVYSKS